MADDTTGQDTLDISQDRAASRFHQINALARAYDTKMKEVAAAAERLKTLKGQADGIMETMREAAHDAGDLPLFPDLQL